MNKNLFLIGLSLASFFLGLFYFAYSNHYIIINIHRNTGPQKIVPEIKKKIITCWLWQQKQWTTETTEILWSEADKSETLNHIITNWLTILTEEGVYTKKLSIQAISLLPNNCDALISFDRNPFSKESSIFEKFMWAEGLIKTIRENNIGIQSLFFLVNHQPLYDAHLDFSSAWPISGFIETDLKK